MVRVCVRVTSVTVASINSLPPWLPAHRISDKFPGSRGTKSMVRGAALLLSAALPAAADDCRVYTSGSAGSREKYLVDQAKSDGMTGVELAQFLGQCAHECDSYDTMTEYASGAEYEGRCSDLGNCQTGDGVRYKGRGYIQITGRYNYRTYGGYIGQDLEGNPALAEQPEIAAQVALQYWKHVVKPSVSDFEDTTAVTRLINGGTNGLPDRQAKFAQYRAACSEEPDSSTAGPVEPTTVPDSSTTPAAADDVYCTSDMSNLASHAQSDSAGKRPDGRCYAHVSNYIDAVGYGDICIGCFANSIPSDYWAEAHQFADYLNSGSHAAELKLANIQSSIGNNPYLAPEGSIVVVRAGTPGTSHPTAGDIAVKGSGASFWNGGEMGYGGSDNFPPGNNYVLGIFVPVCDTPFDTTTEPVEPAEPTTEPAEPTTTRYPSDRTTTVDPSGDDCCSCISGEGGMACADRCASQSSECQSCVSSGGGLGCINDGRCSCSEPVQPDFPGEQACRTCVTTCSPCRVCADGPDGSFYFGSCDKCWHCWDWDDDELEDQDEDMDKDCDALHKDHDWNDEEVRCLTNEETKAGIDCRACWSHMPFLGASMFV